MGDCTTLDSSVCLVCNPKSDAGRRSISSSTEMNKQQRRAAASLLNRQTKKDMLERVKRINEKYRHDLRIPRCKAEQALWTLLANLGIKEASDRW